ncbi:hypothetical protein [Sphingopyxis sp. H115]|uniref:hypothetical protein n=1 Tax=Sphingopyxis sp. H115 TaxID=1759073 RepID=UPI00128EEB73|nr:hypothetical protein [Sphingopyxis sp. H115]
MTEFSLFGYVDGDARRNFPRSERKDDAIDSTPARADSRLRPRRRGIVMRRSSCRITIAQHPKRGETA